jgi:hypothetical protein
VWALFLVLWQGGDITQMQTIEGFENKALCNEARERFETADSCTPDVLRRSLIGFCVKVK